MKVKNLIVSIDSKPQKLDEFDLAGLNLTEEQKTKLKELMDSLIEQFRELEKEFQSINFYPKIEKKKSWNKKRFYD